MKLMLCSKDLRHMQICRMQLKTINGPDYGNTRYSDSNGWYLIKSDFMQLPRAGFCLVLSYSGCSSESTYYLVQLSGLGKTVSAVGNPDNLTPLLQSFYHCAVTFFTIGYGDVYPQGLSRVVSGLEGFMGVFMMSYFTVAFVRKVLR